MLKKITTQKLELRRNSGSENRKFRPFFAFRFRNRNVESKNSGSEIGTEDRKIPVPDFNKIPAKSGIFLH